MNKVTFTGSVATGKAIARAATGTLKRVSLELGGKSPHIVFDDADLERAIFGGDGDLRRTRRELHRGLAPVRAARRV